VRRSTKRAFVIDRSLETKPDVMMRGGSDEVPHKQRRRANNEVRERQDAFASKCGADGAEKPRYARTPSRGGASPASDVRLLSARKQRPDIFPPPAARTHQRTSLDLNLAARLLHLYLIVRIPAFRDAKMAGLSPQMYVVTQCIG
jgi:hypothetical protein